MHLIEHTFAPNRLLLVWQAPDGHDRTRFVVGELRDRCGVVSFRYLSDSADFHKACELGFVCYPAFRKTDAEYTEGVMDAFLRRMPPRTRGDFSKFLEQYRLSSGAELSDFALLAYSGAKLPSDGFSVVWPLEEVEAPGEVLLEVAGFRYQGIDLSELKVGMSVSFVPEPENPKDNGAIRIEASGKRIGYVNRLQCNAVMNWLDRYDVEAFIERFNGTADRPIVYVFCRLSEHRPTMLPRQTVG